MAFCRPVIGPPPGFCFLRAATESKPVHHPSLHFPQSFPIPSLPSPPPFFPPTPPLFSLFRPFFSLSFQLHLPAIMFRSAVVRSLRASVPRAVKTPAPFQIRSSPVARPAQFAPRFAYQGVRLYSAPAGLNKDEVEGRIVNLLKNFDKVRSQSRVSNSSLKARNCKPSRNKKAQ